MTFYELMNIGRSNVKYMVLGRKDFTHKTCLLLGKQSQPLVRRSSRGCGSGCSLYLCSDSSLQLCSEFRPWLCPGTREGGGGTSRLVCGPRQDWLALTASTSDQRVKHFLVAALYGAWCQLVRIEMNRECQASYGANIEHNQTQTLKINFKAKALFFRKTSSNNKLNKYCINR